MPKSQDASYRSTTTTTSPSRSGGGDSDSVVAVVIVVVVVVQYDGFTGPIVSYTYLIVFLRCLFVALDK